MARWIGVDLDGTLAEITGTTGRRIGKPVQPMLKRVKRWLADGKAVKIMTARRLDQGQIDELENWLMRHDIEKCGITNSKDPDMIELWDDNALRVERNTGKLCSGCKSSRGSHSSSSTAFSDEDAVLTDC